MAIQEIWNAKKLHEQEKGTAVHLQDFMYLYLVRSDPSISAQLFPVVCTAICPVT